MAPARWEHNPRLHHDPNTPILGRLVVATPYGKGHTKTKRTRYMPVHPHATGSRKAETFPGDTEWRRRESNPPSEASLQRERGL